MKRVKGCLNSECSEYKKTYFKASDENCMICGSKLSYVCKYPECFKAISDDTKECYCPIHIAERKDKKKEGGNGQESRRWTHCFWRGCSCYWKSDG